MSVVVTEFTAKNSIEFDEAYDRARRYVEEIKAVSVLDIREVLPEARSALQLAMYAANHPEITEDSCVGALNQLVNRQVENLALNLGIAAVGAVTNEEVAALDALLMPTPLGASRWVEGAADPEQLFERIVRWLLVVLNRRHPARSASTLAQDAANTIDRNLPIGGPGGSPEMDFWRVR